MKKLFRRILIVDDDYDSQLIISKALESMGYEFDIAVNGDDAVEHINFVKYDLIIIDIFMPVMNGFEFCDYVRLHMNRAISSTKIIGISADKNLKRVALSKGMDYFIEKPINFKKFKSLVELYLSSFT